MGTLIGQTVMEKRTMRRGIITKISGSTMTVVYGDDESAKYSYPGALASILMLQDEELQDDISGEASEAEFTTFKSIYSYAVKQEIDHLRQTGGKKTRIIDGILLRRDGETFIYNFDTDSELHFPDSTPIKLWFPDKIIPASVISCEEFTITIQVSQFLEDKVESVEFTAEPWHLMEALIERIGELDTVDAPLAYEVACGGRYQVDRFRRVSLGQDEAFRHSCSKPITFIWGPPGTGKTTTLAKIALEYMHKGKRVLMLSYSNVSVDGALLRVADRSDHPEGSVIRYGYPRVKELMESDTLTSYAYVLKRKPKLAKEYRELLGQKRKLKRRDPRRIEINNRIGDIRAELLDDEKALIQRAAFVATTVSKAVVDKAIYSQRFDLVIFDEASMAYVPQVVYAASLAKQAFCCLGDFKQLPAIVQNPKDTRLTEDIFSYTHITEAVENGCGHEWLVMLNTQYRMHPMIADFVGRNMYHGLLQSPQKIYEQRQEIADLFPVEQSPMAMVDLSGTYSVCIKTMDGSHINLLSAMLSFQIADILAEKYGVGIITPYSAQSRLVLAMIRDMAERDDKYLRISSATVHQFQGSEKPIIIYDAVDCYVMPYPGMLLTEKKNDTANRLFNVAMTRAQGKFILLANIDYLLRKRLSRGLLFRQAIDVMEAHDFSRSFADLLDEGDAAEKQIRREKKEWKCRGILTWDRYDAQVWGFYLNDLATAKREIFIDVPGLIDEDEDALEQLGLVLSAAENRGVGIMVRAGVEVTLPKGLQRYAVCGSFVTTPYTIIDREIIWFGEPLASPDFIAEGDLIPTEYFPCIRFEGKHTARMLKAIFEIPSFGDSKNEIDAGTTDQRGTENTK